MHIAIRSLSTSIAQRIESQMVLEESIRNDPIELLIVSKKDALDHEEHRAWTSEVSGACRACLNYEQCDEEPLSD